jgi:hypothetical protein
VKIVLMGTTHEVQENDYQGTHEFKKVLVYLCRKFPVRVIMEEWTERKGDTVGKRLASEQNLEWVNVGTPSTRELKTFDPWFDPSEDPPMLINRYGPADIQTRREGLMLDAMQAAMRNRETGMMIVGMAHLHSMAEKLVRLGFEIEGFHWTVPAITLSSGGSMFI